MIQQREFLIKVLEACVTLKTRVETDLQNGWSYYPEIIDARETLGEAKASLQTIENPLEIYNLHTQLILKKQRLQAKYQEATVQCQLDDLIGNSGVIFDFTLLKQALASINMGEPVIPQPLGGTGRLHGGGGAPQNPILFLANYCMSQLYSRHVANKQQQQQQHNVQNGSIEFHHPGIMPTAPLHIHQVPPQPPSAVNSTQLLIPTVNSPSLKQSSQQNSLLHPQQPPGTFVAEVLSQGNIGGGGLVAIHSPPQQSVSIRCPPSSPFPLYFFNIDVNGSPQGRIVIEVRPDAAPKMAKNFSVLSTGEIGVGYKGCTIFQCWEGESVITGDFELNNGRGGRSIFEDGFFMPDDTKFPAVRGAVGMRRTQKRHDNLGMVGSQFRIILQEMRGFTGIFGHVVEGLDLVEKISTYGDQTGKPTKTILITKSGKL